MKRVTFDSSCFSGNSAVLSQVFASLPRTRFLVALIRVIDSEPVIDRFSYFANEIAAVTNERPVKLNAGLCISISSLQLLVDQQYLAGFDEIWLFRNIDEASKFDTWCNQKGFGPYDLFSKTLTPSQQSALLAISEDFLGMLDGAGVVCVVPNLNVFREIAIDVSEVSMESAQ